MVISALDLNLGYSRWFKELVVVAALRMMPFTGRRGTWSEDLVQGGDAFRLKGDSIVHSQAPWINGTKDTLATIYVTGGIVDLIEVGLSGNGRGGVSGVSLERVKLGNQGFGGPRGMAGLCSKQFVFFVLPANEPSSRNKESSL